MNAIDVELFDGIVLPDGTRHSFKKTVSTKVRVDDIKIRNHPAFNRRGQAKQLTAKEFIAKGEFLGCYGGKIIDNDSEEFEWNPYQITPLKKETYDIDGMEIGNILRYINDPRGIGNIEPNVKFYRSRQKFKGYVMVEIYTLRDIEPEEEIFASYGEPYWTGLQNWYKKENPHTCPNCPFRTSNKDSLTNHIRFETMQDKPHECEYCGKTFKQKHVLENHLETHIKSKIYSCETCDHVSETLNKYKAHKTSHLPPQFECFECNKYFSDKGRLETHMRKIHNSVEYANKCHYEECEAQFQSKTNLQMHINEVHLKLRPFICDYEDCKKAFASRRACKEHKKSIHIKEFKFICSYDDCIYKTNRSDNFITHTKRKHTDKRKYECDHIISENPYRICAEIFDRKSDLTKHRKELHEPKIVYQCDYEECGHLFNQKGGLKRHREAYHEKIRNHECGWPGCEFTSYDNNGLDMHIAAKHQKKSIYECDYEDCDRSFPYLSSLIYHKASHK